MKIIGLDVGTRRIGVARADTDTRIAIPDSVIMVNGHEFNEIARVARQYNTTFFVLGLPRSNNGNETAQSTYVRNFAKVLAQAIPGAKVRFQDESLTSVEAEQRLRSRKKAYEKGEIDAEAAAIILQDFIEHFSSNTPTPVAPAEQPAPSSDPKAAKRAKKATKKAEKGAKKNMKLSKKIAIFCLTLVLLIGVGAFVAYSWYESNLRPVYDGPDCAADSADEGCQFVKFTVNENDTIDRITDNLRSAGLIRHPLAFKIYVRLSNSAGQLKSGEYDFRPTMSIPDIVKDMMEGVASTNVFNFTIIPGDTIANIKQKLAKVGYTDGEIDAAFNKHYDLPVLKDKPESVSLEGYLFGDTYQFYIGESVENILTRAMTELWRVVEANNLIAAYEALGLNLHQGIVLASIVQKEAKTDDQPQVAQVFLKRLRTGIALGSDVTATYAADLMDPARRVYTDNAKVLAIDSPYNTRKYSGLPPGAISNPGVTALLAVAHPAEGSYIYFLTGDDGKMYYSYTESEHQQNIRDHCQELCNALL